MTLSQIISPPRRVQFITNTQPVENTTSLFGIAPSASALLSLFAQSDNVILQIDATPRQTHRIGQKVPKHPVEEGFPISDDVQPDAKTLILDCVISDIPPELLAAFAQPFRDIHNGNTRSSSAWTVLKGLVGEEVEGSTLQPALLGKPFTVVTSLDVYRDMLVEDINLQRSRETGEAISFSINLSQIRIVTSARTSNRDTAPDGAGADSNVGRVGTSPANPASATQASSLATAVNP